MIAFENCELDAICLDDGVGRIRLKGGGFLPGMVYPEGYRALHYCFVCTDDMDGVTYCGLPLTGTVKLVEPRIVATVAKAGVDETISEDGEIPILSLEEAFEWMSAHTHVHGGNLAPWPGTHCGHVEWESKWENDYARWRKSRGYDD